MDDAELIEVLTVLPERVGHEHQPDVKELVFELWALVTDHNIAETVRLLKRDYQYDIHPQTVYGWARTEDWETKAQQRVQLIWPALSDRVMGSIKLGSYEAIGFVRQAIRAFAEGDAAQIAVWGKGLAGTLNAALGVIDRAGHSHVGLKPMPQLQQARIEEEIDFSEMSVDELMTLDAALSDPDTKARIDAMARGKGNADATKFFDRHNASIDSLLP